MDRKLDIVLMVKDMSAKGFKAVQGRITSLGRSVFSLQGQLLALAGVGGFGALVKSSFTTIDQLAKTSDKLGISTEALAGMRHAAELTGVATRTMDMALQRMVRRVAEAAGGTGEARNAIRELGLDAKKLAALSPDKQFAAIADRMKQVSTQGERVRLAFKLFDSEGVAVVNTLRLGSEGLRDAAREADALGLSISRVDAKRIEDVNDAMTRIQGAAGGIGNTLAISLADPIEQIATNTTDWVKANQKLIQQNVAGTINQIGTSLNTVVGVYNGLPEGVVGAAGYGILGRVLFGSWGPAKAIAAFVFINEQMDQLGMGMGDLKSSYGELNRNMAGMWNIISGNPDANYRLNDAGLGDLDAGQDSSGYVYKGGHKNQPPPESHPDVRYVAAVNEMMDAHVIAHKRYLKSLAEAKRDWQEEGDGFFTGTELADLGIGATDDVKKSTDAMKDMVEDAGWSMKNSFSSFFDATSDGFFKIESLALDISQSIARSLSNALSDSIIGNTGRAAGSTASGILGFLFSAHGNVFSGGHHVPFAKGGIVNRPTVFPFASGIGLMGEAGPEAIMPLTRTAGGDLGVRSQGGGGGTTIIINAMDVKSFQDKLRREGAGVITGVIGRDIMYNGSTRGRMRGSL